MANSTSIVVLKFGGSVLRTEPDFALAVHEITSHVRAGRRVVAVASALRGATDALFARAAEYGPEVDASAIAALIARGEEESAALLALALDRAGIRASALPASGLGIAVGGAALDADVLHVDPQRIRTLLATCDVVVAPGFLGVDALGRVALLGRGGSDLTALLLADALEAECILVKDVDGLHPPGETFARYATLGFDDALALEARALQTKAARFAQRVRRRFSVRRPLSDGGTLVGHSASRLTARRPSRRASVALLGLGVVGRGVYERLLALPDRFQLIGVAVRDTARHAASGAPVSLLVRDAAALARRADIVIEAIGGLEPATGIIEESLRRGAHVISANKALIARSGERLARVAAAHGGTLRFSAAVGGATPCLELVERVARERAIESFEGIINATTNVILDAQRDGATFEAALEIARQRGYAEADPSADIDGTDAAEKLQLLCRAAFGRDPDELLVQGIRGFDATSARWRLVARAARTERGIVASVQPEALATTHPLASVRGAWNRLIVTGVDGKVDIVDGKGAGRWPTAESVIADALDAHRAFVTANEIEVVA